MTGLASPSSLKALLALSCVATAASLGFSHVTSQRLAAAEAELASTHREAAARASASRIETDRARPSPVILHQRLHEAGISREDLRAILREELQALDVNEKAKEEAEQARIAREETDENIAAFDQAETVIAKARAARRWTNGDAATFRHSLVSLTEPQVKGLLSELLSAVNRQELKVETDGELF